MGKTKRTLIEKLEDNGIDVEEMDSVMIDDEAFVESVVGVTPDGRLVYDAEKMMEELMEVHGCSAEDAREHIEFNIFRSLPYIQGNAPIVYDPLEI